MKEHYMSTHKMSKAEKDFYKEKFGIFTSAQKYQWFKEREESRKAMKPTEPDLTLPLQTPKNKVKRVDNAPQFKRIINDADYYNGQTVIDSYRVLLGKRAVTTPELVARYKAIRGSLFQSLRVKKGTADKVLAVSVKRGGVSIVAAIVCVYSSNRVVWHDVTVTGKLSTGEVLPNLTSKLPQRVINERIPVDSSFKVQTCVERVA